MISLLITPLQGLCPYKTPIKKGLCPYIPSQSRGQFSIHIFTLFIDLGQWEGNHVITVHESLERLAWKNDSKNQYLVCLDYTNGTYIRSTCCLTAVRLILLRSRYFYCFQYKSIIHIAWQINKRFCDKSLLGSLRLYQSKNAFLDILILVYFI